jgi:hypothetical protein
MLMCPLSPRSQSRGVSQIPLNVDSLAFCNATELLRRSQDRSESQRSPNREIEHDVDEHINRCAGKRPGSNRHCAVAATASWSSPPVSNERMTRIWLGTAVARDDEFQHDGALNSTPQRVGRVVGFDFADYAGRGDGTACTVHAATNATARSRSEAWSTSRADAGSDAGADAASGTGTSRGARQHATCRQSQLLEGA